MNSTTLKATLRTNNRALAKALETKKAELTVALQTIHELRTENQFLQSELHSSRAGLGMDAFEREVEGRVMVRTLHFVVVDANLNILDAKLFLPNSCRRRLNF